MTVAAEFHIKSGLDHKTLGIYFYSGGHSGPIQETSQVNEHFYTNYCLSTFLHWSDLTVVPQVNQVSGDTWQIKMVTMSWHDYKDALFFGL
jgi:hypothetical protein